MRLLLLSLLLVVAVNGGIFDKIKEVFTGQSSLGHKLKNATVVGFKKLFENTALFKIRDKIRSMKDKVLKTLELSPQMMKSLQERLKKLRPIKQDKVQEMGDTITEVNENSEVDQYLYQGDVVLTEEQAEEIVEDIEDEVAGGNRTKRQAFKDHRYPKMLWSQGLFENTALFKIRDKIRSMKDKVLKTLELSPQMMKSLQERLKKLRPIKQDKVQEMGDTITEVNENSEVDQYLYQGDVVLTEEQAEEIVEDIEDEVAGENRTKRQAFKDHRYPKMLWSQGVNYYFHNLASRELRSVFTKGAKLWERDTCINFTQNRLGKK
ncbi:hypothetical protein TELCIR_11299, partial [Teladorsagia circumcincta]